MPTVEELYKEMYPNMTIETICKIKARGKWMFERMEEEHREEQREAKQKKIDKVFSTIGTLLFIFGLCFFGWFAYTSDGNWKDFILLFIAWHWLLKVVTEFWKP